MKTARLKVVKVAETRFVLNEFEGMPWSAWVTDSEHDASTLVEFAGRGCYQSWHKPSPATSTNEGYIRHILEMQHYSVIEHAGFTVMLTGISRSCSHELVRHRHLSFCLTGDTLIYSEIYNYSEEKRDGKPKRRSPVKHRLDKLYAYTQSPSGRAILKKIRVRCLDEATGTFTQGRIKTVVCSGIRPVFRVELEDGRFITCSKDHRFLTPTGWMRLEEIVSGLEISPGGLAVCDRLGTEVLVNGTPAYQDRGWLAHHYHDNSLDQATIGALAGVSKDTIRTWIRKYRLQKPLGSWTKGREPWNKGKRYKAGWRHSQETRKLLAEQKRAQRNPAWKGGITRAAVQLRRGLGQGRKVILERDGYSCRLCGAKSNRLTLHHILPIWARPDLAAEENNLIVLCRACHLHVNGLELQYVERFGRSPSEIPPRAVQPSPKGFLLIPRARRIIAIRYVGEQMTYDLVMDEPHHNFVANGIVTHNSQLSQRFVNEDDAPFVIPPLFQEDPEAISVFEDLYARTQEAYRRLTEIGTRKLKAMDDKTLRRKRAREAARCVLPNMTETHMVMSGNHRAWREFFEKRGELHVDAEMREVALTIFNQVARPLAPAIYKDFRINRVELRAGETVEVLERNRQFLDRTPTPTSL